MDTRHCGLQTEHEPHDWMGGALNTTWYWCPGTEKPKEGD